MTAEFALDLHKLKQRSQFLAAARGLKCARPELLLQINANQRQTAGVGFTASKKVGNAVVRNRAKRRLREVARQHLPQVGRAGMDYVLVARQKTAQCPFPELLASFVEAARQLHARLDRR